MKDVEATLVLIDTIQEVVGEDGETRSMDSKELGSQSRKAIESLTAVLGEPEKNRTRGARSSKSHQFGGHDVVEIVIELMFALQASGIIKGGLAALTGWIALKKGRKARIKIKGRNGVTREVELTGYTEEEVLRILQKSK